MKHEPIKILPYNQVQFRWVCSHYDHHLHGICVLNGSLHEFKCEYEDVDMPQVKIYELSILIKLKWLYRQWLFEKCIGYHWTYPHRKNGQYFYYRKPNWFYKLLFKWYYKK